MEDSIQNGVAISPVSVVPKRGRKPLPKSDFRDILHKVYNNIFEESVCSDLMDLFGYKVYSDLSKRLIKEEAVRRRGELKELRIKRRTKREGEPEGKETRRMKIHWKFVRAELLCLVMWLVVMLLDTLAGFVPSDINKMIHEYLIPMLCFFFAGILIAELYLRLQELKR